MTGDWDTTGPVMVAPGVHRLPLPLRGDGLRAINVYAIEDGDRIVMIDAGSSGSGSLEALKRGLAHLGASLADISTLLVTHGHYDHYGLTSQLRAASEAIVALGERERELINAVTEPNRYRQSIEHRRQWLTRHGAGAVAAAGYRVERQHRLTAGESPWRPPDRWLSDGDEVRLRERTLRVQSTPGHTRGHIVYHDEAHGLLFAGDHVLPHITPSLGFEPFPDGGALEQFLESLAAVRNASADLVLPGHGPAFDNLRGRVDELVEHHRDRLGSCVAALADGGARSASAVADRLTWTRRSRTFSELDTFNRMLAVSETVAHLELLVHEGQLKRELHCQQHTYALAA